MSDAVVYRRRHAGLGHVMAARCSSAAANSPQGPVGRGRVGGITGLHRDQPRYAASCQCTRSSKTPVDNY